LGGRELKCAFWYDAGTEMRVLLPSQQYLGVSRQYPEQYLGQYPEQYWPPILKCVFETHARISAYPPLPYRDAIDDSIRTICSCGTRRGREYAGREFSAMLEEAGFSDIEVTPTFGYYSVVIGRKPDTLRIADTREVAR